MRLIYVLLLVIIKNVWVKCDRNVRDNKYKGLPQIFHIDDYEKCKAEGKLFCKASIILLQGSSNISLYWALVEESIKDKRAYNHNELFHAICVNNFCPGIELVERDKIKKVLSKCYSKRYENLGLKANITHLNCSNHDDVYKAGTVDYIWLLILTIYGSYILTATFWDYQIRYKRKKCVVVSDHFDELYLYPFSIITNWEKLTRINTSKEFQKLKCIQGIRFYNMLLIIFCHTYSSYVGGYVLNTDYIEDIPNNPIRLGIRNLMVFLVQTFFLFSSFLLSYHFFQIIERPTLFNKKFILITFLNRYLRIIPPVLIMIGLGSTIWIVRLFYGPIKDQYSDLEYQRCQKNWWTSLLFINNHYNQYDMCYFITWYLAADTQLYMVSLIIISIIWKFRQNTKRILMFCVIIGILIPSSIAFVYNLDIIYRITPENSKNNKFRSFMFNAIYSSSYANLATYMVGICFGYIYFKSRNYNIFKKTVYKALWLIIFISLPTAVVFVSSYYYSRLYSAILCGILKPLYATGIAVGIFGMSRNIGGIIKNVCEWKPALFLGNFTYSTYVVHYVIVFYRTATAKQPLYVSDFVLVTSFMFDVALSFLCGFFMHILVEMPALQIQNMIVPQIRKQRITSDKDKKQ